MKAHTSQQQTWLGWEQVDLKSQYFFCMCQVGNRKPSPLSGHKALTSALHYNGNIARNWKAEGGVAKETGINDYNKGIWLLTVEGQSVKLFVKHIDRSPKPPIAIDETPLKHEKGARGRSEVLLSAVRQAEWPSPTEKYGR